MDVSSIPIRGKGLCIFPTLVRAKAARTKGSAVFRHSTRSIPNVLQEIKEWSVLTRLPLSILLYAGVSCETKYNNYLTYFGLFFIRDESYFASTIGPYVNGIKSVLAQQLGLQGENQQPQRCRDECT